MAVAVTVVVGWLEEDWPVDGWLGAWAPEQIPAHASRARAKEKDKLPGKRIHFRLQDGPSECQELASTPVTRGPVRKAQPNLTPDP